MIKYFEGDVFTSSQPAFGHGVNCKGRMRSGIAVDVRLRYPDVYEAYARYCKSPGLNPGDVFMMKAESDGKLIFNLASQYKEGCNATYPYLEESLWNAFDLLEEREIEGIALPRIGCGVGGLNWAKVKPMIEDIADNYSLIEVEIWTPAGI